jgi:hypothetical protein
MSWRRIEDATAAPENGGASPLAMAVTQINQGRKAIRRVLDYGSFDNANEPKRLVAAG